MSRQRLAHRRQMPPMTEWLSCASAANRLGVEERVIRGLAKAGKLTSRPDKAGRVLASEIWELQQKLNGVTSIP